MCSNNRPTDGPNSPSPRKLEKKESNEHATESECEEFQDRRLACGLASIVRGIDYREQRKNFFGLQRVFAEDRLHGRRRWCR